MPKGVHYTLTWSSTRLAYELRAPHGGVVLSMGREQFESHPCNEASTSTYGQQGCKEVPEWFAWLGQGVSFTFVGQTASCLVRRESKQRGSFYWCAYLRTEGILTKKYVGKTADVTLARLEDIASLLSTNEAGASSSHSQSRLEDVRFSATPAPTTSSQGNEHSPPRSSVLSYRPYDLLLVTKLSPPRLQQQVVHRPHLAMHLQQRQEQGGVTLISAPAGYGKTTVVADWLASSHIRAAWLSLDSQDNDLLRFLHWQALRSV